MHISQTLVTVSCWGGWRVISWGTILIRKITGAAHQVFHASVLRWQNYPLSWDNAFHFCRIFPSRVKDGLWSWGETRTCQLLMLEGRSPKILFFYGESNMWIPIDLMHLLFVSDVLPAFGWKLFFSGCISRSSPIKMYLSSKRWQQASCFVVVWPGIYESPNSNVKELEAFLTYFLGFISEALISDDRCVWNKDLKSKLCWRLFFGPFGDAYVCI